MLNNNEDNFYNAFKIESEYRKGYYNQRTIEIYKRLGISASGVVKRIDPKNKEIVVSLGHDLYGYIPFEDLSINNLECLKTASNGIQVIGRDLLALIGKVIRAKVIENEPRIILSRKQNMKEYKDAIFSAQYVRCQVVGLYKYGVFVDVGEGFIGFIPVKEISRAHYVAIEKWIKRGDVFYAKVINSDYENNRIDLSRKQVYDGYYWKIKADETITGKIVSSIPKNAFVYYVEVNPGVLGLLESKKSTYKEGQEINMYVKRVDPHRQRVWLREV